MIAEDTSSETDDYGFFLDLESSVSEQEQAEFYVVATKTHYEVRRKSTKKTNPTPPPPVIQLSHHQQFSIKESRTNSSSFTQMSVMQDPPGCISRILNRLSKLPHDVYYSCLVCSVTISCVYFVMTWDTPDR